ncbi:DAK2 domain-containing protein [Alicyclobacillus sp. ALC3]|uniref:DAK2 domain-containing protein n=1 Tax=Alicyclobacillus sp. ALC3 TaxID=2796143 RepID=UPI0023791267|nr:DAK2 domain-containing protein [Alicyclobacillus sp. ALC3]WDL97407.1 DAK2 domain-containing protein [Alicyclobacillus sp. ALC3]
MTSLDRLNGEAFAQLVAAGHARLKRHVGVVNSLNIFPVPDGDTGTNMELSLASGVVRLLARTDQTLFGAAQALASGLLMGARGNSGVILSQLFRGFIRAAQRADYLDVTSFSIALQEGVSIAYRAVAKPVEGTILTVAREAAAAGTREARQEHGLEAWMAKVCDAARVALSRTPEQLAVLKEAGVVDSGGQGLVYIYEGFLAFLRGEEAAGEGETVSPAGTMSTEPVLDFAAAHIDHEGEFGYCTETLIRVDGARAADTEEVLRQQLATYGDSLLVVSAEDLVKVHVHTLHPGRVLEDALIHGTLIKIKIDNMTEQHTDIQTAQDTRQPTELAVVAVVAGEGLQQVFTSLGATIVVSGGQTMNPSTEDIVDAVRRANAVETIVLPNNRNIVMAANQARDVLGESVQVVPSRSIPEGIAALMAMRSEDSAEVNAQRMEAAMAGVNAGQVVRAVRDSVFQERVIKANQYLGLVDQDLTEVGDDRLAVALNVISAMGVKDAELLTVFYGSGVASDELERLTNEVENEFGIEVEVREGGQPVYDYIFALE